MKKINASQNKRDIQKNLVDEVQVKENKSNFYISRKKLTAQFLNSIVKGEVVQIYDFEYDLDSDNYHPSDADIKNFCNILSEKSGLKKAYRIGIKAVNKYGDIVSASITEVENADGYRLATSEEVELAKSKGVLNKNDDENLGVYIVRKGK